jgi:hypothetical protein
VRNWLKAVDVTSSWRRVTGTHALVAVGFAALAVLQTWPLVLHLHTHVPGFGHGDNMVFVWNMWWWRTSEALAHPFHSDLLFAPFGTSLALHTHTALQALIGATLLRPLSPITACNIVILVGLTLNGWTSYLLAVRYVGRTGPAAVAGIVVATSAYAGIHLAGHFNLIHVWTLALFALAWTRLLDRPGAARAAAVAAAFVATAYTDYYYAIYEAGFAAVWWFVTRFVFDWRIERRRSVPAAVWIFAGLAVLDLTLISAIMATGGFGVRIAGHAISISHTRNPLTLLWALVFAAALSRWRVLARVTRRPGTPALRALGIPIAVVTLVSGVLLLPLLAAMAQLVTSGGYATEHPQWLSGLAGVDLATMVMGSPVHGLFGAWTRAGYDAMGIDMMEQSACVSLVAIAVAAGAVARQGPGWLNQPWTYVGALALLWSLGPFLTAGGLNTALVLPEAVLRYVPVLSNARVPGRAMAIVNLSLALLAARAVIICRWKPSTVLLIGGLVLAEGCTAPYPIVPVPPGESVERALLARPGGSVLELPAGLADGFGTDGVVDRRSLIWQTQHGHPIVGGFVARLSPQVKAAYQRDGLLWRVIELSAGRIETTPLPADASDHLLELGIRYVVLNRDTARPELVAFAEGSLRMHKLAADGPRELYELTGSR